MKLISYNVNGIRAAIKKGFRTWLQAADPDFLLIQEVKAKLEDIPLEKFKDMGYLFFTNLAIKKGYSGVAIFSKSEPEVIYNSLGYEQIDEEGRYLELVFEDLHIIDIYVPTGAASEERQIYKWHFMEVLFKRLAEIRGKNVIIGGDFNICHTSLDICNPKANLGVSGFMPEERQWFTNVLEMGYCDSFREFNEEPHHYTWWSYMKQHREKNIGWRIDYFLVSNSLKNRLNRAAVLKEAKHADHCPILLEINDF